MADIGSKLRNQGREPSQRASSNNRKRYGKNRQEIIEDTVTNLRKEISKLRREKGDWKNKFDKANDDLGKYKKKYENIMKERDQYKRLAQQSNTTIKSVNNENEYFEDLITDLNNVAYQLSVFCIKNLEMEKNKMISDQDLTYDSVRIPEDPRVPLHFSKSSAFHSPETTQEDMCNNTYPEDVEDPQVSIQNKEEVNTLILQ